MRTIQNLRKMLSPSRLKAIWFGTVRPLRHEVSLKIERKSSVFRRPGIYVRIGAILFVLVAVIHVLPRSSPETRRWTLSALAQSAAALLGLIFIGVAFIADKAQAAEARLAGYLQKYISALATGRFGQEYSAGKIPFVEVVRKKYRHLLLSDPTRLQDKHPYRLLDAEFNSPKKLYTALTALSMYLMEKLDYDFDAEALSEQLESEDLVYEEYDTVLPFTSGYTLARASEFFRMALGVFTSVNLAFMEFDDTAYDFSCGVSDETYKDETSSLLAVVLMRKKVLGLGFVCTVVGCIASLLLSICALLLTTDDSGYGFYPTAATYAATVAMGTVVWFLVGLITSALIESE